MKNSDNIIVFPNNKLPIATHQLLEAYRKMKTIREFENRIHNLTKKGEIPGFLHLSAGQEAGVVGICMHLSDQDFISSTHRGHGHCIAKGCDVIAMMDEIYGKASGLCGGKGGSMHMADLSKGMLGANGIVGGGVPLAAGAALKSKIKGDPYVSIAFFGDGALNEGATLETMNLAKVLDLPMLFVMEDNGFGASTASSWAIAGDVIDRAKGFGLAAYSLNGNDFFEISDAAGKLIEKVRAGSGPVFLHLKVHRIYGHFEGDSGSYRSAASSKSFTDEIDCIELFKRKILDTQALSLTELQHIDQEVTQLLDFAVEHARLAEEPHADDLTKDVYVSQ